ncbi:MAG: Holliday junction resolvase RuvX [Candidatus Falkowbacteria bacterium]|nr:Holliday junction resolvase RuvX [Candidatus Falkowbacteria bacterium]
MTYLGIDWGEKRIGLALAEAETRLALPFKTVDNLGEIIRTIEQRDVSIIVLGLPLKLSGLGEINPEWQKFKDELEASTNLPVALIDERLSSKGADALIGSKSDKASRDEIAAAIILQEYLDKNLA